MPLSIDDISTELLLKALHEGYDDNHHIDPECYPGD
jgi:hypothetical protein